MVWLTDAELVAAVSNAGGLGSLGPNAGQCNPETDVEVAKEAFRAQVRAVRQLTSRPFAGNYIAPPVGLGRERKGLFSEAMRQVILEERVPVVVMVSNDPASAHYDAIQAFRRAGIKVLFRDVSPSLEKAMTAQEAGADVYLATGREGAGLISANPSPTSAVVADVSAVLTIPVIAAGGIVTAAQAVHAAQAGAQGVLVGTRFVASVECRASPSCKDRIIAAHDGDTVEIGSPATGKVRILSPDQGVAELKDSVSGYLTGMVRDDTVHGFIAVTEEVGQITSVLPVGAIVRELGTPFK